MHTGVVGKHILIIGTQKHKSTRLVIVIPLESIEPAVHLVVIPILHLISGRLAKDQAAGHRDVDVHVLAVIDFLEAINRRMSECLLGNIGSRQRRHVHRRRVQIINARDDRVLRDRVSALHQLVDQRDRHIVIRADDRLRKRAVFSREKVCCLGALVRPVVPVEDHVGVDFVARLLHRVAEACETLVCVLQILASHDKTDVVAADFLDDVFRDIVHDLAVIGNDGVEARLLRAHTHDRRKVRRRGQLLEKLIIQARVMQRIRTENDAVIVGIIRKREDLL